MVGRASRGGRRAPRRPASLPARGERRALGARALQSDEMSDCGVIPGANREGEGDKMIAKRTGVAAALAVGLLLVASRRRSPRFPATFCDRPGLHVRRCRRRHRRRAQGRRRRNPIIAAQSATGVRAGVPALELLAHRPLARGGALERPRQHVRDGQRPWSSTVGGRRTRSGRPSRQRPAPTCTWCVAATPGSRARTLLQRYRERQRRGHGGRRRLARQRPGTRA